MSKTKITSFPREVREYLGNYVYALVDPRDGRIFYVGKGKGDRILSHEKEANEALETYSAKHKLIQDIEKAGLEVSRHFIRIKIKTGKEALAVEQGVIEALRLTGVSLTNLVSGHGGPGEGATSFEQVIEDVVAKPLPSINEPVIFSLINKTWHYGMSENEISHIANGYWNLSIKHHDKLRLMVAVAFGIVRGVYWIQPNSWFKGNHFNKKGKQLWGFRATPAPEFANLIGHHVRDLQKKGAVGSFRLFLDGYPGAKKN